MNRIFLLFVLVVFTVSFRQQPNNVPTVSIINPINGTVFDGDQIRVDFIVTGTAVNSVRILIDDKAVQLLEVDVGQNTAMVEVPARDCKISIIARSEFGMSVPAVVHLKRSEHIFKPTLYVLAIGVSKYLNPDLQLQFAAKDAIDFAQSMLLQKGLLYENVELRLLTDNRANAENIRDGLNWLQHEITYRDVAMLYMAGHGINNNVGEFFFMPVNANLERLNATCVSYREIKGTIDAIPGKVLVFMDACHSGNILGNTQRAAMLSQAINDLTGVDNGAVVFTSSTGRQFSLENPDWDNGAFTKALVEGLSGEADLFGRQTITVKNLDLYITNRVKELTGGRQSPTTIIPNSVPDFPIAVVVNIHIENVNIFPPSTTPKPAPVKTADGKRITEPEMVFVQGGTFTMGCTSEQGKDCAKDEKTSLQVTVSDFYICKYEVTQELWESVMGSNPSTVTGANLPVSRVSWDDVQEFIKLLNAATGKNYRLPTEAEWEYAARGGNKSQGYKYSGSNNVKDVAWYRDNSGNKVHPVGGKQPNELDIYDMSGNILEWCSDWYASYNINAKISTSNTATRVVRGGNWRNEANYARVSSRLNYTPNYRFHLIGFRLVLPLL